jgi:hypothetical protein
MPITIIILSLYFFFQKCDFSKVVKIPEKRKPKTQLCDAIQMHSLYI